MRKLGIKPHRITGSSSTQEIEDDGAERNHVFVLNVVPTGRQSQFIEISAKDFTGMTWVAEKIGALAIVYPNLTQYARTAIQELSKSTIRSSKTYRHIGWTEIDGEPSYSDLVWHREG